MVGGLGDAGIGLLLLTVSGRQPKDWMFVAMGLPYPLNLHALAAIDALVPKGGNLYDVQRQFEDERYKKILKSFEP